MIYAEFIIDLAFAYGGIGAVLAAMFLLYGVDRVEKAATGSYLFRVLVLPGVVGLWPLVLVRWIALERAKGRG